jgi:hypothetical protein
MRAALTLLLLSALPAQADVLGALTACQVERDRLEELPAAIRAQGWRAVTPPINADQARRLAFAGLVNAPGVGDLTLETPVETWMDVWNTAIRWSNEQMLPLLTTQPDYAFMFDDVTGNLLFIQAGETDTTFSITCTMAVSTSAASVPGFLPELTPNPGPFFVESHLDRPDNAFSTTTRILSELSLRPQDFTSAIGVPSDVAGILFTSTTWTKEAQ